MPKSKISPAERMKHHPNNSLCIKNGKSHGMDHTLPPTPVITRWITWLHTGYFHSRNQVALKIWIEGTEGDT
jgi:hypothetical protein